MTNKGRNVEVEMELNIHPMEFSGSWFVAVGDRKIGSGFSTKELAEAVARWLSTGIGDITDLISDAIDEYFKELEKP